MAPTFQPTGHVLDYLLDFLCSNVSIAAGERERERGGKIVKRGFVDDGN